jgi:hypothetical protein
VETIQGCPHFFYAIERESIGSAGTRWYRDGNSTVRVSAGVERSFCFDGFVVGKDPAIITPETYAALSSSLDSHAGVSEYGGRMCYVLGRPSREVRDLLRSVEPRVAGSAGPYFLGPAARLAEVFVP